MDILIKHLKPGDEPLLERVADDVFDAAIDSDLLTGYLLEPHQHLIVALSEGEVIGQVRAVTYGHPDKKPELFIENLGVTSRKRRQGVATRLLDAALQLAKSLGCAEAWLITEDDNQVAKQFYASQSTEFERTVVYAFNLADQARA